MIIQLWMIPELGLFNTLSNPIRKQSFTFLIPMIFAKGKVSLTLGRIISEMICCSEKLFLFIELDLVYQNNKSQNKIKAFSYIFLIDSIPLYTLQLLKKPVNSKKLSAIRHQLSEIDPTKSAILTSAIRDPYISDSFTIFQ